MVAPKPDNRRFKRNEAAALAKEIVRSGLPSERIQRKDWLLFCLAGVLAIALVIVNKTPATVVILLAAMFGLLTHPALNLPWVLRANTTVQKCLRSATTVGCALFFVCLFGYWQWPRTSVDVERLKAENEHLKAENDAYSKPLFWIDAIGYTCIHYGKDGTYLFIPVSIQNQGAATHGVMARFVHYKSLTMDAELPVFNVSVDPTECVFHTGTGEKRLVIRNDETIVARARKGITNYMPAVGRLPVKIPGPFGVQKIELESQQVTIQICVIDGFGTRKCTVYKGPYQINSGEIATSNGDEVRSIGKSNTY